MKIRRDVKHCETLPRGYGIAWEDPATWRAICYPVPFHKLIGWLRRVYWDFAKPPKPPAIDELKGRVTALETRLKFYRDRDKRDAEFSARLARRVLEKDSAIAVIVNEVLKE